MKTLSFTTAILALMAGSAIAQEAAAPPAYLDDRSDAAAIVKSFYNAINRKEYARAWNYFGSVKPTRDFETFVEGYRDTASVVVVTGDASTEGAAGSTFFNLPVAIVAFQQDKSEQVFAGCYTARLANPQIQEPPFAALHLEKAELRASEQPFEEKLPAKCGDGPSPQPKDAVLEQAIRSFTTLHATDCSAIRPDGTTDVPESHQIEYRAKNDTADEPQRTARLLRFYCGAGAYNESSVYYLWDTVSGLREQQFATPELDIRYPDGDTENKTVESVSIIGYTVDSQLVNSSYDPATMTISSYAKWRGIGDASSSGLWLFRDGAFSLVKYDVDASYDEEINPETVLDYDTAP